jgi:hypothetical protein
MTNLYNESQETQNDLEQKNEKLEQQCIQLERSMEKLTLQAKGSEEFEARAEETRQLLQERDLRIIELENQKNDELEECNRLDEEIKRQSQEIKTLKEEIDTLRSTANNAEETEISLRFQLAEKQTSISEFMKRMENVASELGLFNKNCSSEENQSPVPNDAYADAADEDMDIDDNSGYVSLGESPREQKDRHVFFDCNVGAQTQSQLDLTVYRHSRREANPIDILVVDPKKPSYSVALLKAIATGAIIVAQDWLSEKNRFKNPEKFQTSQFPDYLKLNHVLDGKTIHFSGNDPIQKDTWIPIFEGLGMKVVYGKCNANYSFTTSESVKPSNNKYNAGSFTRMFFKLN